MIYALTPEQHAQIVDALHIDAAEARLDEALAMLKGLKPLEPSAWLACDEQGNVGCSTKENHALRCCEAGTKAEPLYALEAK